MTIKETSYFRARDYHPLGPVFPDRYANKTFCNSFSNKLLHYHLTTPYLNRVVRLATYPTIKTEFGLFPFRSPLLRKCFRQKSELFSLPPGTEMFYFPGCARKRQASASSVSLRKEFPHSETSGSKPVQRLPEHIVATQRPSSLLRSQGIHHTPLNFLLGNLKTT